MTTAPLADAIKAQPFRPFVLHVADGGTVAVSHPELIAYAGGRTAVVMDKDEHVQVLDLLLVTRLEFEPAKSAPKRKGK